MRRRRCLEAKGERPTRVSAGFQAVNRKNSARSRYDYKYRWLASGRRARDGGGNGKEALIKTWLPMQNTIK